MEEFSPRWINQIFLWLKKLYGNRWHTLKSADDLILQKKMWFNALKNLSYEQIQKGLAICKNISLNNFPAPCVIKFKHFCLNPILLESKKRKFFANRVPRRTCK